MKKILLVLTAAAFVATASQSKAALGWFSDYVLVSIDGGAAGYYWIGSDPGFGTAFNGANFGSITTLTFGADMKYWSDTQDRIGGAMNVKIDSGGFTEYIWTQSSIGGNDYQGLLATDTVNVANGLPNGVHTVSVFAKNWGSGQGDSYLSNDGANYTATFTVIPEPSTYALLALSAVGMGGYVIRRRR